MDLPHQNVETISFLRGLHTWKTDWKKVAIMTFGPPIYKWWTNMEINGCKQPRNFPRWPRLLFDAIAFYRALPSSASFRLAKLYSVWVIILALVGMIFSGHSSQNVSYMTSCEDLLRDIKEVTIDFYVTIDMAWCWNFSVDSSRPANNGLCTHVGWGSWVCELFRV